MFCPPRGRSLFQLKAFPTRPVLVPILRPTGCHLPTRQISSSIPRYSRYVRFQNSNKGPLGGWDIRTQALVGVGVLVGVYYVAHLEQVPETGRWRFMNTSPRHETELGELARREAHEEFKGHALPPNHPVTRHVRRVVSRILAASNLGHLKGELPLNYVPAPISAITSGQEESWNPDDGLVQDSGNGVIAGAIKEWEVMVINDSKMINAQAVPGLIMVYTGILPICQDEQGLAAVLSHEIGHVLARHTAERVSSQTVAIIFIALLQAIGIDFSISKWSQTLLLELPNSRAQEKEADIIGLRLMSQACFDPRAAPEMFTRLARVEEKSGSSRLNANFLRTHPTSDSRVEYLEERLPEGYAILAANPDCAGIRDKLISFREAMGGGGGLGHAGEGAQLEGFLSG